MQMLQHCLTRMEQRHILTEEENIRNSNAAWWLWGSGHTAGEHGVCDCFTLTQARNALMPQSTGSISLTYLMHARTRTHKYKAEITFVYDPLVIKRCKNIRYNWKHSSICQVFAMQP